MSADTLDTHMESVSPQLSLSPTMNVPDCAFHIGRTAKAVRGLIYRKQIPYRKFGAKVQFNRADIDRWMARHNRRGAMV